MASSAVNGKQSSRALIIRALDEEPVVFSAVEFANAAHPLLRFLCEISTARSAACAPFSWGAASRLPFLPRVCYGRRITISWP